MDVNGDARLIRAGELEIHPDDGLVLAGGRTVRVSRRELQLLAVLVERAGRVVSREELYALTWGGELRPGDRCVDVYVHKLRSKLEAAWPDQAVIHTHFGFGYRLHPEPSQDVHRTATAR
jgi:DNA-binding response OmpR family regulator